MSERGRHLVRFARAKLREALGGPAAAAPAHDWASEPGCTFVTWRWRGGRLQGCIGTLEGQRPIVDDVAHNAVASGMRDPRARAIALADLDELDVELSILSPLEPIASEELIEIGVHGVVIAHAVRRATFLPIMWQTFRERDTFMGELKRKAGLPRSFPSAELALWRYTVEHHLDPAPGHE